MPVVFPAPGDRILTFNLSGRFPVWLADGLVYRKFLTGLAESKVAEDQFGADKQLKNGATIDEQWAVLGSATGRSDRIAVLPIGMAPRWGANVSLETLVVEGAQNDPPAPIPAQVARGLRDDDFWTNSPDAFVGRAITELEKWGSSGGAVVKVDPRHMLFFSAKTTFNRISEVSDITTAEHTVDGKPSRRVFDIELANELLLGFPDRGWMYQEFPKLRSDGTIESMVIHVLTRPSRGLPALGTLMRTSRDSQDRVTNLMQLAGKALKKKSFKEGDELGWYRSVVTVQWGNKNRVKP